MKNKKPQKYSKPQLEKVGVQILDAGRVQLQCKKCEQPWSPNLKNGGRLPKGYWHCPNGCNCG